MRVILCLKSPCITVFVKAVCNLRQNALQSDAKYNAIRVKTHADLTQIARRFNVSLSVIKFEFYNLLIVKELQTIESGGIIGVRKPDVTRMKMRETTQ